MATQYLKKISIIPNGMINEHEAKKRFLYAIIDSSNSIDFKRFLREFKVVGRTKLHKLIKPPYNNFNNRLYSVWYLKKFSSEPDSTYVIHWANVETNLNNFKELDNFLDDMISKHTLEDIINAFQNITWYVANSVFSLIGKIAGSNNSDPSNKLFDITIEF